MLKVLVVDDNEGLQNAWRSALEGKVELISALSIEEAKERFASNPNVAAIVVDACVPGSVPTTLPLVREFRRTFAGPMVAVSSDGDFRDMLMGEGCDCESSKGTLPQMLLRILGL